MNAILDLLVLAIALISIWLAVKKGFVKAILSASSFILAMIVTLVFLSPVRQALLDSNMADTVEGHIRTAVEDVLIRNGMDDLDKQTATPEGVTRLEGQLSRFGIDSSDLTEKIQTWKNDTSADLREKLLDYITEPILYALVTFVTVIALFIGTIIVLKIITYFLDGVFKLPVLRTANKLLGLLLGVLLAVMRVYLFCLVIKLLLPYGQATDVGWIAAIDPSKTWLFQIFYNFNIFDFLL